MTSAGLADALTILIAAVLSFTLVDLIKRRRNARIYLFVTNLWSLARLALPFLPAPRSSERDAAAPVSGKPTRQMLRQASRQAGAARDKTKRPPR